MLHTMPFMFLVVSVHALYLLGPPSGRPARQDGAGETYTATRVSIRAMSCSMVSEVGMATWTDGSYDWMSCLHQAKKRLVLRGWRQAVV